MFNIVQKRRIYFLFSALVIGLGIVVMVYSTITQAAPFRLSIDFVGGGIYEITFTETGVTEVNIRGVFAEFGDENVIVQRLGGEDANRWSIRGSFRDDQAEIQALLGSLEELAPIDQSALRFEQVSPTIGEEVTRAAFLAVFVAALVITGFIVIAFRQVPRAFRYGMCAVTAMVHDVLIVLSAMSLFGLLFGWEVDALFLTAVLTVVGFSIQDSIVIFDRIRENIPKHLGESYEAIANRSVWETIHRTQATQLNAFFIMIAILLFGGDTVRQFVTILMIGLIAGSYSSIFTAVPMLVAWQKGEIPLVKGDWELAASVAEA